MKTQTTYSTRLLDFWAYQTQSCKFHYFYTITNTKNNKIYCGIHSTNALNDDYIGSGSDLVKDYQKYGTEHFVKKIICRFDTRRQASEFEKFVVNKQFILSPYTYNKRLGGDNGGILKHTKETIKKISKASKERSIKGSIESFIYHAKNKQQVHNPNTGKRKVVDKEDLQLYLENGYVRGTGIANKSNLGSRWITDEKTGKSHLVKKESLTEYINGGCVMGIKDAECFEKRSKVHKGLKFVYNKELDKHAKVKEEELEEYLSNGWVLGCSEEVAKSKGKAAAGTVWITNTKTNECIKIHSDNLAEYLAAGWIKKRTMKFSEEGLKKCAQVSTGLVFIYEPTTIEVKRVPAQDVDGFLTLGWIKGRPFKKRNRKRKD